MYQFTNAITINYIICNRNQTYFANCLLYNKWNENKKSIAITDKPIKCYARYAPVFLMTNIRVFYLMQIRCKDIRNICNYTYPFFKTVQW